MTVLRRSGTGTVSCGYSTFDETATAGQDYVETKGTLMFKPGEVSESAPSRPEGRHLNSWVVDELQCRRTAYLATFDHHKPVPPQTRKVIEVPVIDDDGCEPDESFLLTLIPNTFKARGTDCVLGQINTTRIFVLDNDDDRWVRVCVRPCTLWEVYGYGASVRPFAHLRTSSRPNR